MVDEIPSCCLKTFSAMWSLVSLVLGAPLGVVWKHNNEWRPDKMEIKYQLCAFVKLDWVTKPLNYYGHSFIVILALPVSAQLWYIFCFIWWSPSCLYIHDEVCCRSSTLLSWKMEILPCKTCQICKTVCGHNCTCSQVLSPFHFSWICHSGICMRMTLFLKHCKSFPQR